MIRTGLVIMFLCLLGCSNKKKQGTEDETGFSYEKFSGRFKTLNPPFQITDSELIGNKDTTTLRYASFSKLLPDSLRNIIFGKTAKPKYTPIGQVTASEETTLYFVKAQSGTKKAALIYVFDEGTFSTVFPFLIPDNDATTTQVSVVDKAMTITKNISQKRLNTITGEGKEVYDYEPSIKQFSLILTNPLHASSEVINPIDTFTRKHKFAGDYIKNKKNFVSIRDGRYPNQLLVFIHVDKNEGGCTGELKGDLLMTSTTSGVYRQGGDPCVMSFRFTSNAVTVSEDQGCGAHRGLDCIFDGNYPRKKETKPKQSPKKKTTR